MISSLKINIFRRLIYLSCLFHTLTTYKVYSLQNKFHIFDFKTAIFNEDYLDAIILNNLMILFWVLVLALSIGTFKGYANRFFSFSVFILLTITEKTIWPVLDGGNNFIHLILFFLILVNEKKNKIKEINKIFETLITLQFCIVYFFSVISKFQNPIWLNGTAIFYVLTSYQYTTNWISEFVKSSNPAIIALSTYFILFYQFTYPVGIFTQRLKKYYILFGIFFHLFIALIIGLPSFAFHFLASYSIFLNYSSIKWILRKRRFLIQKIELLLASLRLNIS